MKNNKDIDCRILTLEKWNIPKTSTIIRHFDEWNDENSNNTKKYMLFNYFDFVNVSPCNFDQVYEAINIIKKNASDDTHIQQNLVIFTEDNSERVEAFWNKKSYDNSISSYFTMVKFNYPEITNVIFKDCYNKIAQNIERIFYDNGIKDSDYLLYFTLDFSDMVIVAHDISIEVYQSILWQINFILNNDQCNDEAKYKPIKDSMTLYGIVSDIYMQIQESDLSCCKVHKEKFSLSIKISVQNQDLLLKFLKKVYPLLPTPPVKKGVFGRYDVEFLIDESDLYNVVLIQKEIDLLIDEVNNKNEVFNTVKIDVLPCFNIIPNSTPSIINNSTSGFYDLAKDTLIKLHKEYERGMRDNSIEDFFSLYDINRAVIEILKNGFSEDYALCIILPLIRFMQYNIDRPPKDGERKSFYDLHKAFFENIILLAHCTMHNERKFIQAPAFNAVVTDVPPKLLAFYNAVSWLLTDILTDNTETGQDFTFMFAPDFRRQIHVTPISHGNDKDDRIFTIYINEEMLYNPHRVVTILSHETAHYVGDKIRNREIRAKKIFESIIYVLMNSKMKGSFLSLLSHISPLISEQLFENFKVFLNNSKTTEEKEIQIGYLSDVRNFFNTYNYFEYIFGTADFQNNICCFTKEHLAKNTDLKKAIKDNGLNHFDEDIKCSYLSNIDNEDYIVDVVIRCILKSITDNYKQINKDPSNTVEIIREVLSAFSEAYADLIMINVLDISSDEYLEIIQSEGSNYNSKGNIKSSIDSLSIIIRIHAVLKAVYGSEDIDKIINNSAFSHVINDETLELIEECVCQYLKSCIASIDNNKFSLDKIEKLKNIRKATKIKSLEDFGLLRDFTFDYKKFIKDELYKKSTT